MRDLEINGLTGEEETRRQYEYIEKARQYVAQKEKEVGRKLTCCVHTFGCQMNGEGLGETFRNPDGLGYVETEDEHADFVIYNTCTVRENANNKVYGRLGYLSNFKKKNPHMMIASLWLYDAGADGSGEDPQILPFCGSGIWDT